MLSARSLLRPLLGRERPVWRNLPWPGLRRRLFGDDIDCLIFALIVSKPRVFFVQIGSHDGIAGDPLWTFRRFRNWQGLLVEPVDHLFARLKQNYATWPERFSFEKSAIARRSGTQAFHYIVPADDPTQVSDQLGSLDRTLVLRHARAIAVAETRVGSTTVNCLSWRDLCTKHNVREIDLLHVDAEGADAQILEQVDLTAWQPSIVLYEHVHMSDTEQRQTAEHLARAGYLSTRLAIDTIAIRQSALASLPAMAAAWQLIKGAR